MEELIRKFKRNAELTGSNVEIINSSDLSHSISKNIGNYKKVLISINNNSILTFLPENIDFIKIPSNEDLKNISISLTDCICGIAETGSILINNIGYESYMTMLSKKHIVLLNSNTIYEKPRDIFNIKDISSASSFSIITGPSATADMGSLVRGVHGPEQLNIILFNSSDAKIF